MNGAAVIPERRPVHVHGKRDIVKVKRIESKLRRPAVLKERGSPKEVAVDVDVGPHHRVRVILGDRVSGARRMPEGLSGGDVADGQLEPFVRGSRLPAEEFDRFHWPRLSHLAARGVVRLRKSGVTALQSIAAHVLHLKFAAGAKGPLDEADVAESEDRAAREPNEYVSRA